MAYQKPGKTGSAVVRFLLPALPAAVIVWAIVSLWNAVMKPPAPPLAAARPALAGAPADANSSSRWPPRNCERDALKRC